jgi:hypothetical protein
MKLIPAFLIICLLSGSCSNNNTDYYVKDVADPVISLNGTWKLNMEPADDFWLTGEQKGEWKEISVPGECMMQGFPVRHDKPFVYAKELFIPAGYAGKLIRLRFEGVYSYARVWINGTFIRDHSGGFTAWECDITSCVSPGETALMLVEVTDRADEISYASGYAKHQIGGILRNVSLLAVPAGYPEQIVITTDLDDEYNNATLNIEGKVHEISGKGRLEFQLFDKDNTKIGLLNNSLPLTTKIFKISNSVENPLLWDAEHPNLYKLKVSLVEDGKVIWLKSYSFGFRQIEIKGNKFLVNGKQVKLRGADRHDIHPMLGRVSTPEYELKDVMLAKEANMNFIRTSHYPPTENFLKLCDEYGIYVEDETAVCFVGSHRTADYRSGNSENSEDFAGRYLSQLEEMVNEHRNHPSVIFWSIGNENMFGINFKRSYDWVKSTDPSRPVIFSYPGHVPDSIKAYDLFSMHYPGINGDMDQYGIITRKFGNPIMPVIFDEWAHVACYNNFTVKEDPNIRDFWGISLDSMWQKTYDADGGLGGAIWCMIDETFMLPPDLPGFNQWWGKIDPNVIPGEYTGNTVGYGEWGIADTWRRKKPEFWSVKKAYSPVRILKTDIDFKQGSVLEIPVYNRFDFTNMNELTVEYSLNGRSTRLIGPDIAAHSKGLLEIHLSEWPENEALTVNFIDSYDMLTDSYMLYRNNTESKVAANKPAGKPGLSEDGKRYIIACDNDLKIFIDKASGLLSSFIVSNEEHFISGPYLNLRTIGEERIYSSHNINDHSTGWELRSLSARTVENAVEIRIKGDYTTIRDVEFHLLVMADGSVSSDCTLKNIPPELIREIGIKYMFDNVFDSLSWKRDPYWSAYPEDHQSAPAGKVPLYTDKLNKYREAPGKEWQYDTKSFYYNGTDDEIPDLLTNVARGTKENIFEYNLFLAGKGEIRVDGDGSESCRIDKQAGSIWLYISNMIDYPDLSWGNYQRNIILSGNQNLKSRIRISLL